MPIATCFVYTLYHFYAFSGTNLLTRCHSASSCFLLFFCFRKSLQEIFSELDATKAIDLMFQRTTRCPKERCRRAVGPPYHATARGTPWPRGHVVWGPRASTDVAPSPIYCPRCINPKTIRHIRQKHPSRRRHRRQVSGVRSSCSGTLPERGLTPGAISIDSTASTSTPWWFVSSSPMDYGFLAVARWQSLSLVLQYNSLMSCSTWLRFILCNATCCVCWDPMNREVPCDVGYWYYHVYVICDLACSPLLV